MKAMTAWAAASVLWSANWAEQTVCMVKKTSMPMQDERKRRRRPARSTENEAKTAQAKFQIWRIPLMRSWVVADVMPIESKTLLR